MLNQKVSDVQADVRARQTRLLRGLLLGMLALLALATTLGTLVSGREALDLQGLADNLVLAGVLVVSLWLLGRGRFNTSVWLASVATLLVAVQQLVEEGIGGQQANLLIFIAPITLSGLLLGRRALFVTSGLSLAAVLAVFALEQTGSSLAGWNASPQEPASAVIVFAILTGLLVLFLDRFALSLHDALARAAAREADLQREMDEREQVETRLRLASDAAHVGVWSWNLDTGELIWSEAMRKLFAVPPDAPVTLETFFGRIHPEDRDAVQHGAANPESGGEATYRIVLPDGGVRWLVGRGQVVTRADGTRQMVGAAYDITPIKDAEAAQVDTLAKEQDARQEAERMGRQLGFLAGASRILSESLDYKETLDRVAHLVVPGLADWCAIDVLNDEGQLERVTVVHSDPEKVRLAHELQRRYPSDPNAEVGAYQVLRSGEPQFMPEITDDFVVAVARDEEHLEMLRQVGFSSAIVAPLKSRERALGVLTFVQSESGRHYSEDDLRLAMQLAERAAVAVDNAKLYKQAQDLNTELERRVQVRTAQLEKANRELEAFTYSASHDLRAPLRGINGFSQALLDDYGSALDDTAREYLQRIHAGAKRMGELIDDLLMLSRIARTDTTFESVDLSALAREVGRELHAREPERKVTLSIGDDLYTSGDARLLRIAVDNLMGNAWKFTAGQDRACIEVGWDAEQKAFFVRDNGAGFDMAYADKLFVPFQRLHSPGEYEGTGIGLATTQRIIERHGGRIWAESTEGEGATFFFTLESAKAERPEDRI